MRASYYEESGIFKAFLNKAIALKQTMGRAEDILVQQKLLLQQPHYICLDCHLLHSSLITRPCHTCTRPIANVIRCPSHLAIACMICFTLHCKKHIVQCEECINQVCAECAKDNICKECYL